jgi:DNA polymerase III subunit delta'
MIEIIGVRFKANGKVYYFSPGDHQFQTGDLVVVETSKGTECGEVTIPNKTIQQAAVVQPLKQILRPVNKEDRKTLEQNRKKEIRAFHICEEKIAMRKLEMKLLLCEHPENGQPCGHCKSCHNLQKDCHPDLILVPHSGKLGGFSVETVRQICSSVSIPPNNGSRKVYLFLDCDQMDDRAQNLLLKQLEEPPAYAFFLFTASAKDTLLSTIRSRILSFGLIPCQPSEVQEAATALGIPDADFQRFPGNIGQTLAYATDSNLQAAVARIEDSIQALQQHNEYAFLKAVATIGKDRPQARFFLQQLRLYVRDVLVLHNDPSAATCSCAPQLAKQAARQTAQRQGLLQFETIRKAEQALQANGTVPLLLATLCGTWMQIS